VEVPGEIVARSGTEEVAVATARVRAAAAEAAARAEEGATMEAVLNMMVVHRTCVFAH
jgi:hypothetical protein